MPNKFAGTLLDHRGWLLPRRRDHGDDPGRVPVGVTMETGDYTAGVVIRSRFGYTALAVTETKPRSKT